MLITHLKSMQTDIAELKGRPVPPPPTDAPAAVDSGRVSSCQLAHSAQEQLEETIRTVHAQFAKFDADGSGFLSRDELASAINSLGSMPGGRAATSSDVNEIMLQYDKDGNDLLDAEEFKAFVRDLVLQGKLDFKDELQQAVDRIALAASEDPWSDVLQGDSGVRSMIENLRVDGRNVGRRALFRGETGLRIFGNPRRRDRSPWEPTVDGSAAAGLDDDSVHRRELQAKVMTEADLDDSFRGNNSFRGGSFRRQRQTPFSRLCSTCCMCVPVLDPDGKLRSLWNVLMALLIVYCGVVVPLEIAFDRSMEQVMGESGWEAWEAWNLLVDCIFIADIFLNFRTGFIIDGQLVKEPRRIAHHYLRTTFFIDLIGSFPLNLVLRAVNDNESNDATGRLNRQLRLLRILKLNRLLRLFKLSRNMKYLELAIKFNPSGIRLVKLIIIMLACCHWMGCAWWFVADLEISAMTLIHKSSPYEPFNDWQPSAELLSMNASLGLQFSRAFFWGTGMVTSMVPYDIEPATEVEAYFTALCMFLGLVLNAFVIGSMASALSTIDSKKALAANKLRTIEAYLNISSVAPELRASILEFYEYLYTSAQSMQDLKLYQDLPPALGTRLAISVHRRVVARAPFLYALSDDVLLAVLARLKAIIFVPGQVIFAEGQPLKAIYFKKRGKVVLLKNLGGENEKVVRVIGQYENFGLYISAANANGTRITDTEVASQLLRVQTAEEWARAETYCDITTLSVADLADIFTQERLWSKLAAQRRRKPTASIKRVSTAFLATKFLNRRHSRRVSDRRMSMDSDASDGAPGTNETDAEVDTERAIKAKAAVSWRARSARVGIDRKGLALGIPPV